MDVDDPHAPFDPTPSSSTRAHSGTPPPPDIKAFSNADFYASHFESHVASVAAHFRGDLVEPVDPQAGRQARREHNTSFPSDHFRWTERDRDIFFASLRRRGKSWPDLITADMEGRKSLVEVTAFLAELDQSLNALPPRRRAALRQPPPAVREVSDRWLEFEEDMAADYRSRSRKREREDDVRERRTKRAQASKSIHRTIGPPVWKLPGAEPVTAKQRTRRNKQISQARKDLEKVHAREDWLEVIGKEKALAITREVKHPTTLAALRGLSSDEDEDTPTTAPVDQTTALATISFDGGNSQPPVSSTPRPSSSRNHFRGGKLRREIVVMGLGDILRQRGLDVFSFMAAEKILCKAAPDSSVDSPKLALEVMESAVGLLRRYLVKVLREVLALKPSSGVDSSAESSVAEFNSEGGSLGRLVTGRSVHRALQGRKVLAAESDAWVDEDDSPAPPSSAPPLEQPDYGSLAHPPSTNGADDSDDEMQPLRAVSSQPSFVSARFDSNITPLFTSRHYTRPLVHYSSERPLDDETYSIGVVPFEKEESPASTRFFLERSQIIDVSEDEGDFEDELEADARMDHDDFAADLAWEEGLWQTIRNMDDDGLGWLTLGNLIDTDNRDINPIEIFSGESEEGEEDGDEDDDDEEEDVGSDEGTESVLRSSQYSQTPPPRLKAERS